MTKFEIGDKVRILDVSKIEYGAEYWSTGDITEVARIKPSRGVYLKAAVSEGDGLYVTSEELRYIEKVSQSPTKNQRLSALEQQVAELQAEVATLKQASKPTYKLADTAEVFIDGKSFGKVKAVEARPLSANEQRKAIIAEAKAFVADVTHRMASDTTNREGNAIFRHRTTKPEFFVNAKKRTVVALIKGLYYGNPEFGKAIAKCAPDDVFNADIGKAIALGRALGLDVERFEQAVKPTDVVVGMEVEVVYRGGGILGVGVPDKVVKKGGRFLLSRNGEGLCGGGDYSTYRPEDGARITDDTGAKY